MGCDVIPVRTSFPRENGTQDSLVKTGDRHAEIGGGYRRDYRAIKSPLYFLSIQLELQSRDLNLGFRQPTHTAL